MPSNRTFRDVFVHELQDIYNAEQQILQTLPVMARNARAKPLASALQDHLKETQTHVTRLENAFASLHLTPKGQRCAGMEGILDEGKQVLNDDLDATATDAAIIGAAQRVEHYETAVYGTLVEWAKTLGHDDMAAMLSETLQEETRADAKLTELARSGINTQAARTSPPARSAGA